MKFVRFGPLDQEKPGCIDDAGNIRDISSIAPDLTGDTAATFIDALREADLSLFPVVKKECRRGACIAQSGKFVCIGLNYFNHAKEAGREIPTEPVIFMKATSSICGANDDFELPIGSSRGDWEAELGIIIGKRAKNITEDIAIDHVLGYCTINDGSERAFQSQHQGQWTKGKSHDSFGPIGPWLVTHDEIPDPQNLQITCDVDGHRYQNGNTADMIFSVKHIVAYLSQFMTLLPGDIIATGTPAGVGLGIKPDPVFLKEGQTIRIEIEGLGVQTHKVVQNI